MSDPGTGRPRPEPPDGGDGDEDGYTLLQQGVALLDGGSYHAACAVLDRAVEVAPDKASVHEARARALFRCRRFDEAAVEFRWVVERNPADDYAHFGLGVVSHRLGDLVAARRHLRIACAMQPDRSHYRDALARVER